MRLIHSRHKKNHRDLVNKVVGTKLKTFKYKLSDKDEIIKNIIERLNISEDILNGAEIISLVGKRNIVIENYIKVVVYDDDRIIIKTKKNYVLIEGRNLKIEYMLDIEISISGVIDNISFNINYPT